MRRNIVYKVVFETNGKLMSSNTYYDGMSYRIPDFAKLEYGVGKTTSPQIGKLFVFGTLEAAKKWSEGRTHNNSKIIKGYATAVTMARFRLYVDNLNDSLERFWSGMSLSYHVDKANVPAATFFCDSFTGLEVVKG